MCDIVHIFSILVIFFQDNSRVMDIKCLSWVKCNVKCHNHCFCGWNNTITPLKKSIKTVFIVRSQSLLWIL